VGCEADDDNVPGDIASRPPRITLPKELVRLFDGQWASAGRGRRSSAPSSDSNLCLQVFDTPRDVSCTIASGGAFRSLCDGGRLKPDLYLDSIEVRANGVREIAASLALLRLDFSGCMPCLRHCGCWRCRTLRQVVPVIARPTIGRANWYA